MEDFRFTTKGNHVYILTLDKSVSNRVITLKSFAASAMPYIKKVKKVSILNSNKTIKWKTDKTGLILDVPASSPDEISVVYKVELE